MDHFAELALAALVGAAAAICFAAWLIVTVRREIYDYIQRSAQYRDIQVRGHEQQLRALGDEVASGFEALGLERTNPRPARPAGWRKNTSAQ